MLSNGLEPVKHTCGAHKIFAPYMFGSILSVLNLGMIWVCVFVSNCVFNLCQPAQAAFANDADPCSLAVLHGGVWISDFPNLAPLHGLFVKPDHSDDLNHFTYFPPGIC